MERRDTLDPEDLQRPDWNSLVKNYDLHDIGEAYLTGRLHQIGLLIEHWGIDRRYDDESLIYDNKMDLRLWEAQGDYGEPNWWPSEEPEVSVDAEEAVADGGVVSHHTEANREYELKGVCDVKTKSSESWLGIFNLRHLAHYSHWADVYDAPVFIFFTLVEPEEERVGEESFIVPVEEWDGYDKYVRHFDHDNDFYINTKDIADECPYVDRSFGADDGNPVVVIEDEQRYSFDWLVENVL